ncbi:MAG: DNA polymerase III subunit alpha, partial [Granulosicoccaceae bacterium]
MSAEFVHLHLHTEYSLVDSVVRIKKLMPVLSESMAAVALTDQSNMMGAVKFYRAALGAGLKPILGVDAWVGETATDDHPHKLVLLAQNDVGYKNLSELISLGYQKGQYRDRAVVQREWLNKRSTEGLIALSGARYGDIGAALIGGAEDTAEEYLSRWRSLFGDRFYLEVQRTGRTNEELYLDGAVRLASATGTPLVATNDVVMVSPDQFESHEARVCINQGRVLADPDRPRDYSDQQYAKSAAEMTALFEDIPSAVENTVEIAKRCSVKLSLGTPVLPDFPIPEGMTEAEYFCQVSFEGLAKRLEEDFPDEAERETVRPRYEERLQVELDVINGMGFPGYFLIVADFIQWSKDNDIPVGPGRGSGAGSLVAYALLITDLDPLPYDLLFERFLNPERVSMPDFDIDFCIEGRDRVIQYVKDKYGHEKVSQIITYGTMAAKAVVRDCGRILGHPYGMVDGISKLVPFEVGMTLTKALEVEPELKRRYDEDEEVHYLLDLGLSLEGIARNAGMHAGGVVIAPTGLTDFCPLYCEPDGSKLVTQFDKDDAEAAGLVKFDFLGLRNLTIIDHALGIINQTREEPLAMAQVALDDKATFDLLQRADTTAVFQLESRGMKDLISRLQPDTFEDIVALVALFRPGPLSSGMVDDFIARKHGREPISYPHIDYQHDSLKPVLEPTYGIILYQEQVMQIAQILAGYTLGGADMLRRAMGKKKAEEMAKQRAIFLEG